MPEFLAKILTSEHITALVIAVVAIILVRVIGNIYKRYKNRRVQTDGHGAEVTFMRILFDVLRGVIIFLAISAILQVNGINISSMVTSIGLVSVVLSFALQDPIRDLAMGLHVLKDHFYTVGDVVNYRDFVGEVVTVTLGTTKIRALDDGTVYMISNRNIDEVRVLHEDQIVDVPLGYDEDHLKLRRVMEECARRIREQEGITDCVSLGLQEFGDSALSYRLRLSGKPANRGADRRTALAIVQDVLAAEGIAVPFNQLDVHCDIVEKK